MQQWDIQYILCVWHEILHGEILHIVLVNSSENILKNSYK